MYDIKRRIGKGTYSRVYEAIVNGKTIALKVAKLHFDGIENWHIRELELLSVLKHKSIDYVENIKITDQIYVEMKCIPDTITYDDFSFDDAINYIKQLLNVIGYLHYNDVAHRDLKPANILIDNDKNIHLIDFNLSKVIVGGEHTPTMVTLYYRAPEIIEGKNYDPKKIDMWSIGCIIMEILSGNILFEKNTEVGVLKKQNAHFINRELNPNFYRRLIKKEYSTKSYEGVLALAEGMLQKYKKRISVEYALNEFNIVEKFEKIQKRNIVGSLLLSQEKISTIKNFIKKLFEMYDLDGKEYVEDLCFDYLKITGLTDNIKNITIACFSLVAKDLHGLTIDEKDLPMTEISKLEIDILEKMNYRILI